MVGDTTGNGGLSDECYDLSDNYVTVTRVAPEVDTTLSAGTVMLASGETEAYTCPGDGVDDVLMFENMNASDSVNFTYVVTNADGEIVGIPDGDSQNFEGAGEGVCYVYGLAYVDSLTAVPGDQVATDTLAIGEFALSENFIIVNRDTTEAGVVSTSLGLSQVTTTPGDSLADVVEFMAVGASNSKYTYIVTDTTGMIIGIPEGNSQDFDGATIGICQVWGLAYTGGLLVTMGDDLSAVLSDGCFDLSDNFVTIIRQEGLNGGVVSMPSGATTRYTCPGDSLNDIVMFSNSLGSADGEFTYVVTDPDGVILGLPEDASQNFEGASEGVCYVWGLSYTGMLTAEVGDTATAGPLSDGESDLSDNFITVIRSIPDGGMVTTVDGDSAVTTTVGDGVADVIEFASTEAANSKFTYIITDSDGNILGIPEGNSQDFEGAGAGICLVWGLSYTGNLTAEVGDSAATTNLSDECFDLSDNFVQVTRVAMSQARVSVETVHQVAEAIEVEFVNPVRSFLEGAINVSTGEHTVVSLFNTQGNLIKEWKLSDDSYHTMDWNLSGLGAGMYILNVRSGNSMESRRLVKL